jgi:hypothetical protein
MENRSQKKVFVIIALLFFSIATVNAQLDTRTQNQIKAKFLTAQELYDADDYTESLEKIYEIEALTNGQVLTAAQNLKVKCLIDQRKISQAKDALYVLEGLQLSSDIIRDVATHNQQIERFYEREKELEEQRAQEKEEEIAREKEAMRVDEENWREAQASHTIYAYEAYLENSDNKIYRSEAKNVLAEDVNFIRIREAKARLATPEGLTEFYFEIKGYYGASVFEISKSPDVLRLEELKRSRKKLYYEVHKIDLKTVSELQMFPSSDGKSYYLKFYSDVHRLLYNGKHTKVTYQQNLNASSEYYLPILSIVGKDNLYLFCEALQTYLNSIGSYPKFTRRE